MYANNAIARRRPEGWVERRRYFRRLIAKLRPESAGKSKEKTSNSAK
jgi:hypothetical protein